MTKHALEQNPGSNQIDAPDVVVRIPEGSVCVWFRHKDTAKPGEYDYSVPHRRDKDWRVYFLLLATLGLFICALVQVFVV